MFLIHSSELASSSGYGVILMDANIASLCSLFRRGSGVRVMGVFPNLSKKGKRGQYPFLAKKV
jgi:hypothetical protein